jgi:Flp pilus assembly protein TadG
MALADIMTALRRQTSRYLRSSRGNATMIATLSAIPIVGAAGMAIDYARISRVQDEIQLATDAATLFAAGAKTLGGTKEEKRETRQQLATNYLNYALANVTDAEIVGTPTVVANDIAIDIEVKAKVKGSFTNVFAMLEDDATMEQGNGGNEAGTNGKSYGITVKSKASWKKPVNYICMLALNPSAAEALHVKGTADIAATSCSIQVNSSSNSALYQNGTATIKASAINVVGNYSGSNFTPRPSPGANVFNDPLATKFAEDYAATWSTAPVIYNGRQNNGSYREMDFSASGTYTLQPGRYRGGIQVKNNRNIILSPGIYFIENGRFNVQSGGVVTATGGVTIVLTEANATTNVTNNTATRIDVQAGGSFTIKAPATGHFAGLAVAHHPNSRPSEQKSTANSIIGGGVVDMTGIIYYPKQILYITGNGDISKTSDMFSIVADKIYVEGNGQLNIGQSADFEAAGLPALPSTGNTENKISLQ